MSLIILAAILLVVLFAVVLPFGAPYLPTLHSERRLALELLDLKRGQTLIELGSGDGRLLLAAARAGLNVIGYELNPILVLFSRLYTWRYRKHIKIIWRNFWRSTLPECDGIYVFLHTRFMVRLDKKLTQELTSPVKVVSYGFKIPHKKLITEKNALLLYKY